MRGYDFDLVNRVKSAVKVPVTVLGGAGSINISNNSFSVIQLSELPLEACLYSKENTKLYL